MIRFLLSLLSPLRPLFQKSGIDFEKMTALIRIKLSIDNRSSKRMNPNNDKSVNSALLQQGFSMLIMGTFSFLSALSLNTIETAVLLYHSMILVMLVLSLLSEYTQMLFDTRDTHILSRLPINNQTISTAKLILLTYYMLFLSLCSVIVPALILSFKEGILSAILLFLATLLNTLFALLITNLVYMGCMRFASEEKFRNILSYIQIFMVVIVVLGYQAILHTPENFMNGINTSTQWWFGLLPPVWFTSLSGLAWDTSSLHLLYSLIAIIIPVFSAYSSLKWFAPHFHTRLNQSSKSSEKEQKQRTEKTARLLAKIFARPILQNSGFMLSWRLSASNRKFKEAILPSIIYILVLIAVQFYSLLKQENPDFSGFFTYFPLYSTLLIAYMVMENMKYNDSGNYFWLYRTKPLAQPGSIILGAFKALYIKYYIPVFLLISIFMCYIGGIMIIPDILFVFSAITAIILISTIGISPVFPFSQERNSFSSAKILIYLVFTGIITMVFIFIHSLLNTIPFGRIAGTLFLWGIIFFICRKVSKISWSRIDHASI